MNNLILTDEEIEDRVSSPGNLANKVIIHKIKRGRPAGEAGQEIPIEIRKVLALTDGTEKSISDAFGITQPTVSYARNGGTSAGKKEELVSLIEGKRASAEDIAIRNLLSSLDLVGKNIKNVKRVKDVSSIAKDMADIADKMNNRKRSDGPGASISLHLYAPPVKQVEDYEVIDV